MREWVVIVAGILTVAIVPSCGSGSSGGGAAGSGSGGGSGSSGGSGGSGSGGSTGSSGGTASGSGSGGSSGSSGSSSGGSSSGSSGSSSGSSSGGCIGSAFLTAVGKSHLLVGLANDSTAAAMAPFDVQYQYISGGIPDSAGPCSSCTSGCTVTNPDCSGSTSGCWWGCWQDTSQPPGDFPGGFAGTCTGASPPQIPMFTYYQLLQSSGVTEGAPEVTQAATNESFMSRYFADWRFLMQKIGQTVALVHIEPDFWGYAEQHHEDPTSETAAVASANATDCGSMPNTIAGLGQCMIAMTRKYAPHALVALHASAWGTNVDAAGNSDPTLDVAGVAQKTAAFLAACGEKDADFVVVETSNRDAGYYQTQGRDTWWDDTNAKIPDFTQDFTYVKALTEALGKPALYWQTPLGNMSLNNTTNKYQDNRVDYFLTHMNELAAAHAVGAAFGAGASFCTTPETDDGNFVTKAKAYFSGGGQTCE